MMAKRPPIEKLNDSDFKANKPRLFTIIEERLDGCGAYVLLCESTHRRYALTASLSLWAAIDEVKKEQHRANAVGLKLTGQMIRGQQSIRWKVE